MGPLSGGVCGPGPLGKFTQDSKREKPFGRPGSIEDSVGWVNLPQVGKNTAGYGRRGTRPKDREKMNTQLPTSNIQH